LVEAASGVSAVSVSASVAYDALVASTTSAVAQASVSASVAGFTLSYVALVASAALDELGWYKKVRDVVSVADNKTFALSSLKTETAAVSDSTRAAVIKRLAHSVSVVDVINIVKITLRTVNDTVTVATTTTKHAFKNLQHTVVPIETVSRAVSKALADAFSASSATFTSFSKALADTLTAADVAAVASTKAVADSFGFSESGSVISQGYCGLTYFEADYVGEYRTFA
jgi:hypothetical protein